jgi:hypothetical protein
LIQRRTEVLEGKPALYHYDNDRFHSEFLSKPDIRREISTTNRPIPRRVCVFGGRGKPVEITRTRSSGKEKPEAQLCFLNFCLFLYYYYLSTVKISHLRPNTSHSTSNSQSFLFSVKTFRQFVSAARRKKILFTGARTRSWLPFQPTSDHRFPKQTFRLPTIAR